MVLMMPYRQNAGQQSAAAAKDPSLLRPVPPATALPPSSKAEEATPPVEFVAECALPTERGQYRLRSYRYATCQLAVMHGGMRQEGGGVLAVCWHVIAWRHGCGSPAMPADSLCVCTWLSLKVQRRRLSPGAISHGVRAAGEGERAGASARSGESSEHGPRSCLPE